MGVRDNASADTLPARNGLERAPSWRAFLGRFGVLVGLVALIIVFASLTPVFLKTGNLLNILKDATTNALMGAGMTFVILSAEIDLSVGSTLALTSVVGATAMVATGSIWLGVLVMIAAGGIAGLVNGVTVAYFGFPSFIATLGTMWLYRGAAYVYSGGLAVTGLPPSFLNLANGHLLGIPVVVFLIVAVYGVCHFVLSRTTFGRHIYAIGDNKEAARLSGVGVGRLKLLVFVLSGVLTGLGAAVYTSRLFSAQPVGGIGFELNAIAAVVIGGTSLFGGMGGVLGTLVGAVFMATLTNGLIILNVSSFWQQVLMGAVLLGAVGLDQYRKRLSEAKQGS